MSRIGAVTVDNPAPHAVQHHPSPPVRLGRPLAVGRDGQPARQPRANRAARAGPGRAVATARLPCAGAPARSYARACVRLVVVESIHRLCSRAAVYRGYAACRPRCPIEVGLLLNDALGVLDEVQLMDVGLATSAQLDALAQMLWKPAMPGQFLWMSATL